ncbi:sorbosone dehydrogenase family protein [Pseudomonas sp. RIT-PI-AD]|uniref:PQQ-dependent sugar dehydrogenase n=1 Tax=Pseudomonas sp. RIT-PI-AD TaxID=3035294 RepID=UPI0021DA4BEC|nr:sorbosone dehydrogenase family protein [Pseudomonas sp. RIT-PI-AD]
MAQDLRNRYSLSPLAGLLAALALGPALAAPENATKVRTAVGEVELPAPNPEHDVERRSEVIGWADGQTPIAPPGFTVSEYAGDLKSPRWMLVTPNGDLLVAESSTSMLSADRITLFRDTDGDGRADMREVFLDKGLKKPLGMQVIGDWFYVANTDAVWRYPYKAGDTHLSGKGQKILELPAGGYNNHWTRNLLANVDGSKLYVSVGSGSNVGEHGMDNEVRRAAILEINPDGSGERLYASGLRNPVGMAWGPGTRTLWTAVNERDNLGEDLVPDYLTHVEPDGFYGWPYAYFGPHEDPRMAGKRPDLVAKTIVPDVPLGAHTASLGLAFYNQQSFPEKYQGGAFVGQHGSWNRSQLAGYKVTFVPFRNGKPTGPPEDFLGGFIADAHKGEVHGRPVGIAVLPSGALLVADDASNKIWQVQAKP